MKSNQTNNNPTCIKSKAASDFFDAAANCFSNLYGRWLDESKYENIADYKTPLIEIAMEYGVSITKMHKRPFGCEFMVDGRTFRIVVTTTKYSYKRIA